ncbi:D-glucuronyl C5-epimerase family protein [Conexibacter woesei]|uniref:D-glucuronyl C5-epimerase domain protein n=1 Tax=Conexibacter woesei (strain DSM 14684 / CCUG 47730 / CIP 108061 / JCM 11494 / NBRC 100937 / ID131577) TaxID=469383 RepID=D3FFB3_CONWI|nr:D-glucuronyl C5-epimerase family protein [Conexibacter woesei]ADB53706.1 D-glucuronyl C5-epimerase domain protein [Conexibacter woesei DSM 14684]
MIFATVGTHQDGFPRMLKALEALPLDGGEELVVQHGHGAPPANATRAEAFLPFPAMAELFATARVVVTHAGVGSILLATRAGHTPIVVPRLARNGEHVDDHQVELARALERDGRVVVCWDEAQLPQLVASVPPRSTAATPQERPLAVAVGAALRGDDGAGGSSSTTSPSRLAELRERGSELVHGSLGAYLGRGTHFSDQAPGRHVDPDGLGGYHCDFAHKVAPDEYGNGSWIDEVLAGREFESPMMVAQGALGFWERHLDGEPEAGARFTAMADWLVRYGEERDGGIVWRHDFPTEKYGLAAGWISGMTQGEAISVLLRAHLLTGDELYRRAARQAFAPFTVDVRDGGVVRELDGALVIEEYPTETPTAVLNGWIFGLLGLHELRLALPDDEAVAAVFARSRDGLLTLLPRYDAGWWSRYSLRDHGRPDLAKPFYQRLAVVLLDALDRVDPDPRLGQTARRWEAQITPAAMARIAADKVTFRVYRALRP